MKAIELNIIFKLPDDFQGSLNDALQAIMDYRNSDKANKTDYELLVKDDVYASFMEEQKLENPRILIGKYWIAELINNEWKYINENKKDDLGY